MYQIVQFVCEPIFMLSPLPISNDFFLLFFNYRMNNIFIIQRKINNTRNVKNKKMPSQCHSVALLTICGLTCKKQSSFSATCGHIFGISECQTWKKQRSFIRTFSIPRTNIWFKTRRGNLSEIIISICLCLGLWTQALAFSALFQDITWLASFWLLAIHF